MKDVAIIQRSGPTPVPSEAGEKLRVNKYAADYEQITKENQEQVTH